MPRPFVRAALWALPVAISPFASAAQTEVDNDGEALAPVVVTASRFSDTGAQIPGNVTTITRDDIRATPGLSLPDVLATNTGGKIKNKNKNKK